MRRSTPSASAGYCGALISERKTTLERRGEGRKREKGRECEEPSGGEPHFPRYPFSGLRRVFEVNTCRPEWPFFRLTLRIKVAQIHPKFDETLEDRSDVDSWLLDS